MSKLQNIKAVKELLQGTHKMQTRKTFGYDKKIDQTKRTIGERWHEIDSEGNIKHVWEQCEGYRIKLPKHYSLNKDEDLQLNQIYDYSKCLHESCKIKTKTRLDRKFSLIRNMCADCNFEIEDKMKLDGTYKEYERNIIRKNAESILKDIDQQAQEVIHYLENGYEEVIDADGRTKKIEGNKLAAETFRKDVEEYKQFVLQNI